MFAFQFMRFRAFTEYNLTKYFVHFCLFCMVHYTGLFVDVLYFGIKERCPRCPLCGEFLFQWGAHYIKLLWRQITFSMMSHPHQKNNPMIIDLMKVERGLFPLRFILNLFRLKIIMAFWFIQGRQSQRCMRSKKLLWQDLNIQHTERISMIVGTTNMERIFSNTLYKHCKLFL